MGHLDSVYARLPVLAQHGAVSAYGVYWHWLRFGPGYESYVKDYTEREWLSAEAWTAWQQQQLRELLQTASTKVPYYRRTWDQKQKTDARSGRLEELPLLEKEPIRADPNEFVRQDMKPWPQFMSHTSG